MGAMAAMYTDEMVSYGKNDWTVFAAGVLRWVGKMEKDFGKKVEKCGSGYWNDEDGRYARDADAGVDDVRGNGENKGKGKGNKGKYVMNEWCNRFNGHVNGLLNWTEEHMVECCFMTQKKNNSSKKCTKDGAKYVKKWKKIMTKFTQGARNQEEGEKCD